MIAEQIHIAYQSMIYLLRNQIAVVRDRLEVH